MTSEPWQSVVQRKQDEAFRQIPPYWRLPSEYTQNISENARNNVLDVPRRCGLLSPKQLEITENYDATSLLQMLHGRKLSSYEVTEAFCVRAAIAQQVVCYPFPKHDEIRADPSDSLLDGDLLRSGPEARKGAGRNTSKDGKTCWSAAWSAHKSQGTSPMGSGTRLLTS